jgi:hypothetical protein
MYKCHDLVKYTAPFYGPETWCRCCCSLAAYLVYLGSFTILICFVITSELQKVLVHAVEVQRGLA